MVEWLTRADWGARSPNGGRTPLVRGRVQGAVIHWPGSAKIDATGDAGKARIASALRGWQRFHMDDRGWSDIAYQAAVDQAGRKWTLRGLNIQSGANGNQDVNQRYGAILLILGPGEALTNAMKTTTREVIAEFRRMFPGADQIRPHSAVRPDGTDCPGVAARAAIASGVLTPGGTPPPGDDMSAEDVAAINAYTEKRLDDYFTWAAKDLRTALVADNDLTTQIADVFTPESGDTAAATTLITHTANRAAALVVQQLQPHLAEIKGAIDAVIAAQAGNPQ